ncbi:P-loop containing nucleoside triphosphate hydrolase protein [Annulohypoxylon truncatum]|uniref:P-loop containing nucleoside triphosphate hydrolase protein n=1 Tax=Annulohypoxylon truncatum TaxID=327061 RepID=UPI002008D9D9|nr:P-loop containing nucleoside triphosphate hydrolase protein [Annulohypoxylon truncatum]KAI1212753.1 P-loop containing nucleoside triphosphate hydrolase protein [Annulohypoxylon truncatum]
MSSHRRSRARFEEGNDEHSSGSDSPKRSPQTVNGALSGDDDDDDNQRDRDRGRNNSRRVRIKSSPSQADCEYGISEFQTGAIVRVLVENFVTYEHAEFNPGPNLNMVIGPNGTGKSSLVCAICLGLGFHPRHLGRASNVGEFVKHGKEAAIVEIELQSPPEERSNHVIRMQIRKEDNKTKWWLNGKDCTHQAVKNLTNELRIQIDNLCQFLPQDRVAEFAGLTPVQLLHETLRAAAPEKMIKWHDQLKELHRKHKDLKARLDGCADTLRGHEARQQGSQADVDRLREREAIQKKIQDLHSARAIAEYNTLRRLVTEAKQKKHDASKRLQELEHACGPAFEAVNRKQKYQKKIEAVVDERKRALKNAEAACDQLLQAIEAQDERIKHLQNKRDAENNSHNTKRSDLAKIRRTITDLEARLQNKPPEFVGSEWNQKIRQQEHVLRENEAEKRTLRTRFEELKDLNMGKNREKAQVEKDLEALNSQDGQKLAFLRRSHPDAARGWNWLRENQDEFEKEVFGPPMLNCSVKDKRFSNQIQSLLAQDDFFCFTCQTVNDHKKLSSKFFKQLGIAVSIRTCGNEFASFRPSIPKEQVREMGLEGYAIEYLEGPEPVLAMLCSEKKLHISGVGFRDTSNDQFDQIVGTERIPNWANATNMYRITRRREYGDGVMSTTTRRVNPGKYWTDQPVDHAERSALQRRINELDEEIQEIKRQGQENKARVQEIDNSEEPIRQHIEALRKEKNELQRAATQYATLGDKIAAEKKSLEDTQAELADCRKRIFEYSAQEDQLIVEKARSVLQHKEQLSQIHDAHQALLEVQIRLIEAGSDVKSLEEQNSNLMQQLDEKKAEIENLDVELRRLKTTASSARRKVEEAVDGGGGDQLAYLNSLVGDKSAEDIELEIGAESTKLELIHGVDPAILRQYEKRAQDILELTQRKEEMNAKLESYNRKIESVKEKWEPSVDEVIGKINDAFSYNFEQINCAGEVGIHKDEDFEQWAIEIKVKFRENETLQQLNQHRQSGGERAVSTIFYLMALQSMAQAPFRVVDEINQGMDPRNERMVHERMVEIACREHTSQYFLITPKLLTGLRYDERMRVLCIASGEHMPAAEDANKLDFGNLVKIQRGLVASAA